MRNAVTLVIALASAKYHLGWLSATVSVGLTGAMLFVFCWRHREPFFMRVFVFGLAAGVVELINDTWLVQKDILVYDPGGPYVIDTPLYMPFTWALLFITNCSVALWLVQKMGKVWGTLVTALVAGLYIPGFEAIAAKADWWYYQHVTMWGPAPAFVILSEAMLAVPLPWMSGLLTKKKWPVAVGLGVVEGLVIFGTTLLALKLLDG
jgi:hypothetical protein